jgi:hypothetical protein
MVVDDVGGVCVYVRRMRQYSEPEPTYEVTRGGSKVGSEDDFVASAVARICKKAAGKPEEEG